MDPGSGGRTEPLGLLALRPGDLLDLELDRRDELSRELEDDIPDEESAERCLSRVELAMEFDDPGRLLDEAMGVALEDKGLLLPGILIPEDGCAPKELNCLAGN